MTPFPMPRLYQTPVHQARLVSSCLNSRLLRGSQGRQRVSSGSGRQTVEVKENVRQEERDAELIDHSLDRDASKNSDDGVRRIPGLEEPLRRENDKGRSALVQMEGGRRR